MAKYYCFISGLPEITIDENKLTLTLFDFIEECKEAVSSKDFELIRLFLYQYDNTNLLKLLRGEGETLGYQGNFSEEELKEIITLFKEEDNPKVNNIPEHFRKFIPSWLEETKANPTLSWDDNLTSAYYDFAISNTNRTIKNWFEFNLNTLNLLTAINCKKFDLDIQQTVISENEVAELLRNNHSKDFGLPPVFPYAADIMKITEISSLAEREKKIDVLRWNWLDENEFSCYFDIENIFTYLVKLSVLQRWVDMDKGKGRGNIDTFIKNLKESVVLSDEFTTKK
ncbi:MAG: DUF2764 family protein [Bacteroidales bacterium]